MRAIGMGDNVVDRYINKKIMFPGGNAVNFAVYAKQCGAEASYLGLIADDREGRLVHESLKELGVDLSESPLRRGLATERCDVILKEGDRVFAGSSYGEGEYKTLTLNPENLAYIRTFDLVHCGCYACMEDEMEKLKEIPGLKTYDFSSEQEFRTEEYLEKVCPYVDVALFSAEELTLSQAAELKKQVIDLGTGIVIITNGTKGQTLWDGRQEFQGVVKRVTPVDTMGAGDSFFTSFVIQLLRSGYKKGERLEEKTVRQAFEFAADFSAKTCLVEGAFGFGTKFE